MSKSIQQLKAEVDLITIDGIGPRPNYETIQIGPSTFIRAGHYSECLFVSAEDGKGFADFYGEYRGGFPWVHPKLEEFAKVNGGYWEWENPGCIVFCEGSL
jgi:hypothetical protein